MRVVVVDDDKVVRGAVAAFVAASGHDVVGQAGHGQDGVEKALGLRPDLVITNCNMPVMDGIEATRRIRAVAPDVAVIALTATGDPTIRNAFLEAGAHACIAKEDVSGLRHALRELEHPARVTGPGTG